MQSELASPHAATAATATSARTVARSISGASSTRRRHTHSPPFIRKPTAETSGAACCHSGSAVTRLRLPNSDSESRISSHGRSSLLRREEAGIAARVAGRRPAGEGCLLGDADGRAGELLGAERTRLCLLEPVMQVHQQLGQ